MAKPKTARYADRLRTLQIALVALQRHVIADGRKVLIIVEGRDGAGKDGAIKRVTQHLSPRNIRVIALPKPSDLEATQWYFQRYVAHLPAAGEIVIFNRSWYNRAGVERVMGFCSEAEYDAFIRTVPVFERMLREAGIVIVKYYLDIDRATQKKRLAARRGDPLKRWKISPIDEHAIRHFDDYSKARDAMLRLTDSDAAPWTVVRADHKKAARLGIIADLVQSLDHRDPPGPHNIDRAVVSRFTEACFSNGMLAP